MIAYNDDWLNNRLVREQADEAVTRQCITDEEKGRVYAAYPVGFYHPNFFVRTGLFILTAIIVQFTLGLFTLLIFTASHADGFGGLLIFWGLLIYGGLELMVKKHHFKSGVDDALLWMFAVGLVAGINLVTNVPALANAIIIFVLAGGLFARFCNAIMAAIAGIALLAIVFFSLVQLGALAKAIAPFVIMMVAMLLYLFIQRQLKNSRWKHYNKGWLLASVTALVALYAAGNYYVVREASAAMFHLDLQEGQSIPFAWLFWLFTVAIPVVYIIQGIRLKDAVLLRTGLLLVGAVVFTVRYYYHFMPVETAMVIGGLLFIGTAYGLIKYLKEPKYGFTHKEQDDSFFMDKLQIESLVIVQTFSSPHLPADTGTQFGGGTGEGGGASGTY